MRVLITGAGGFIGTTLSEALLREGQLKNRDGILESIDEILLVDTHLPQKDFPGLKLFKGDLTAAETLKAIAEFKPDSVFHLAAILTSAAEKEPARAMAVNVSALLALIETVGSAAAPCRFIFPSSIAVFGGLLPDKVNDDHLRLPQTSYGTHKAIAEMILADASRHGVIDSRALRLPVVLVHPGPPSLAVSDRIAAIVRDSIAGRETICPLPPEARFPVVSVHTVVRNLITLHNAEAAKLISRRALNQPALTVSVEDMIAAITRVAPVKPRITFKPDPELRKILSGWPIGFISTRAASLDIVADRNFEDIVLDYMQHLEPQTS